MFRDPEDPSCFLNGTEQFFLSQGGTVGTPDSGVLQRIEVPFRSLAAGTGGEMGIVHERLLNSEVRPTAKKHISIEIITQAFLDIG
jgi:hypothetical protein